MRTVRFFIVELFLCVMSLCYAAEKPPSFQVLIVREHKSLRGMHDADAKRIRKTFQSIGDAIQRPVHLSYIKSQKTSMSMIRKWCSRIGEKDIVVVYYSGQDVKNSIYNSQWPLIKIGQENIPLDQVARNVYAKKAKLSLVFADCYSDIFKVRGIDKRPYGKALERVKNKKIRQRMTRIWESAKGTLTMCSSKQGECSRGVLIGKMKTGAFTEALLATILLGTKGIVNTHQVEYLKMVKLSEFPEQITYHMEQFPFSEKKVQHPFYLSTINGR